MLTILAPIMHLVRRSFLLVGLSLILLIPGSGPAAQAQSPGPAVGPGAAGLIIQNVGQFPDEIRYVVWGGATPLWLTEDAIYAPDGPGMAPVVVAEAMGPPQAAQLLATSVSFFRGDDPTGWRTHVPVWATVEYAGPDGSFLRVDADGAITHGGPLIGSGADTTDGDLLYATVIRGSQADQEGAVAVDGAGNAYVVGQTNSTDFPVSAGGVITGYMGGAQDVFVLKLAQDGRSLSYATFLGGKDSDLGKQIVVDGAGNAFVVGDTSSTDYPTTPGAFFPSHSGNSSDSFVTGLNADGSALRLSTFLGGNNYENIAAIALAADGDLILTGRTQSADFFVTPDAYDSLYRGGWDVFVTRFSGDGSDVRFSTFLGSTRDEGPADLAVDGDGNIFVAGYTWSSTFPTTTGAHDTTFNGGYTDIFLTKLKADGSELIYSTLLGGASGESAGGVAVDATGHVYVTGFTASPAFPTTSGAYDTSANGGDDAFVAKFLPDGSGLAFATFLGGRGYDYGRGVAINGAGDVVILGETQSPGFPTTPGAADNQFNGEQDLFVAKLSGDGSTLAYATYLGGSKAELGRGLAVDGGDNVYVSGHTLSEDFATTIIGTPNPVGASSAQILVAKLTTPTRPNLRLFLPTLSR